MGKFNVNSSAVYQEFSLGNPVYSSPAWFNNTLYYGPVGSPISAYTFSGGSFNTSSPMSSSHSFVNCANTGATPSISANGSANGIVWAWDTPCDNNRNHQVAVLYAFDAGTLTELYNSTQNTSEDFGTSITFATPTVANGKVYVGTNTDVAVFGLLNCTYDSNQTVTSSTTFMISVTTGAGCSWSAVSNSDFITITGDASVVGSGTASFELVPHAGASRPGTVVVAGQRYTITPTGSDSSVPRPSNRTPANESVLSSIAGTPSTVSVTPSSGSGASQTFALKYFDTAGASSLQQVWVYFNAALANPARNACLLYYSAVTNQISLLGDNGTTWQAATLGSATTLQNSQCTVNAATSTVSSSGNTFTWNAAMTFKPAYAGVKNTYFDGRGCIGNIQRVAAIGQLDCLGHYGHTSRGLGDAEFGIGREPYFRAPVFGHLRGREPATGVGIFQLDLGQSSQQRLPAVLQRGATRSTCWVTTERRGRRRPWDLRRHCRTASARSMRRPQRSHRAATP